MRFIVALCVLAGCTQADRPEVAPTPPPTQAVGTIEGVNLEPSNRPILAVTVGDAIEAALLHERLGIEPIRVEGNTFYFYDGGRELRKRLEDLGYEPISANPHEVERRVVRISRMGAAPREDLARYGVMMINRERDHWVVAGSVAALRGLVESGYSIAAVRDPEPRPRLVRVRVPSRDDLARLGGMMDIFSVVESRDQPIVEGAAFDNQIDAMRALGFTVEVNPPELGTP